MSFYFFFFFSPFSIEPSFLFDVLLLESSDDDSSLELLALFLELDDDVLCLVAPLVVEMSIYLFD